MKTYSKRYEKYFILGDNHINHKGIFQFGSKFWYHKTKDKLIPNEGIDEYINSLIKKKQEFFITKRMLNS